LSRLWSLEYGAVYSGRRVPSLRMNLLSACSGYNECCDETLANFCQALICHCHGNVFHRQSVCLYSSLLFMWPAFVGGVLFTRAVCRRHSNVLSVVHYCRIEFVGRELTGMSHWNVGLYTGWFWIVLFAYEFSCVYSHTAFVSLRLFSRCIMSCWPVSVFIFFFFFFASISLRTLMPGSVWSAGEYITALSAETFIAFYRTQLATVIRYSEHNRHMSRLNYNWFMCCEIIILPFVSCGCGRWSRTLRKEYRLRVSENRVLRRIFRPERDVVTG
jgi:hypothetical protein